MSDSPVEVILTHEHADFDAVASLVAASLLYPNAFPVLPRFINRNVRAFLKEYKDEFIFYTSRDLPRQPVARAIVVDTYRTNLVRGMNQSTRYFIIDHHARSTSAPKHWTVWSESVGANATLLVEKLMDQEQVLTPIQSTLLALAIHDDTGSLTYASTTHRDARCLAWLLEPAQGAELSVIARYIHRPLSEAQQALLNTLTRQSEFLNVGKYTAVIAQAEAINFKDEFSTIARKMRDAMELDALFLLIKREEAIQVVARSATDAIDVGHVARELGGDGHIRASAAPVHGQISEDVRTRIVDILTQKFGNQ